MSISTRLVWVTVLLLAAPRAHSQEDPAPAPTSQPVPASQPASQPAATAPNNKDRARDARLERLERAVKEQQQSIEELKQSNEDLTDQLEEMSRPRKVFSVYGFFDFSYQNVWIPDEVIGEDIIGDGRSNFVFGNLNTYFDFQPSPSWRVLTEIRLSLNPLGDTVAFENAAAGQAYQRVDVTTTDVTHYGSQFDYGSVAIERAQIEWSRFEWLNITAGLFLTPIGIWNIDHGSPAQTRVSSPNVYVRHSRYGSFFPRRQLGLMAHGSTACHSLRLSYALTLSNGGGPVSTLNDADLDKAVGGRLELGASGEWRWKVGLSGYTGMWSDYKYVIKTTPRTDYVQEYTARYRESILGLDIALEIGDLLVNAELLANWRLYHDDYRPPSSAMGGSGTGLAADAIAIGGYANLAYRLPLSAVQLLSFVEVGYVDRNDNLDVDNICELALGFNWRIRSNVVLKLEYVWFHWPNVVGPPSIFGALGDMHGLQSQLAVAF
jgi:hypothetical protein